MKTRLLIARHGNTFLPGEQPRRVGARTDLPLVELDKAKSIGRYLKQHFLPDITYSASLKRTRQTAETALLTAGLSQKNLVIDDRFREIDYGPDENQPEHKVLLRIGQTAMDDWNSKAEVPPGWTVDTQKLKHQWLEFANDIENEFRGNNILVVTSNGIARFCTSLCDQIPKDLPSNLKIGTGNICLFEKSSKQAHWQLCFWNQKPTDLME